MKLIIESTDKLVELEVAGARIPARVWEGQTESGIPVHCFVTRVAVDENQDQGQFVRELQEHRAPSVAVQAIPMRLIL